MTPTRQQLIDALYNEYVYLCHDDFDPEVDLHADEYLEMLQEMSYDELIEDTQTDENFTLEEFITAYA